MSDLNNINNASNNRNNYVNNSINDYLEYNPNVLNRKEALAHINKKLNEINMEEKQEGINNPVSSITRPIKVETDQYKTKYSQGTTMYDNRGKYFDPYEFNKNFDDYIREQNKQRLLNNKLKLADLTAIQNIKIEPYQLPISQLLINIKDTWFDIFDLAMDGKNPFVNFNQDKIFYVSITFIVTGLIYIMLTFIFE